MDVDKAIKERHSVRNYSDKKVGLKDVVHIMDAGRLAPAAGNVHTIRFVLVEDKDMKRKIAKAALSQHFLEKAQYVIVVCSDVKRMRKAYGERGLIYARHQAGAAIENMLLKIVSLGMGSCWVGAFHEATVKKLLKIPQELIIEALIPVGYSAGRRVERKKHDLDKIV
ncbi:unnamed protein product, partial [marine sediment metagenome]